MSSSNSNILERPGMTERIAKAREKLGDSPAAPRAPAAKPTSAPAIASAAAPVQSTPAGGHDITLEYLFPDTRWFTLDEIAELVDGIDRQTIGKQLGHPVQVIGSDVRRFLRIYALQNRIRITPKPSVVAEILASRAAKEERRAEIRRQVRAHAQQLTDQCTALAELRAKAEDCQKKETEMQTAFRQKHAKELAAIEEAKEETRAADSAVGKALGAAEQLRGVAFQYRESGLFQWNGRKDSVPVLMPEATNAEAASAGK